MCRSLHNSRGSGFFLEPRLLHRQTLGEQSFLCSLNLKHHKGVMTWKRFPRYWLFVTLQWRHNERGGVLNLRPHDCLLNRLFIRTSMKTSKLRVTGLCAGNSPVTGEFFAQRASNAENASIWWRHHERGESPTVTGGFLWLLIMIFDVFFSVRLSRFFNKQLCCWSIGTLLWHCPIVTL